METNFFIFRERLAIACRLRGITYDQLCSSIGLGGRRTVDLEHAGLRALDIYRLAQIADRLDVSIDWLLGRSKAMELREKQCQGEIGSSTLEFIVDRTPASLSGAAEQNQETRAAFAE